ncbi:macro domain-containing protein [Psychrobacillus sp. FSL W7-1457]|uniref:macro domain-containing protein n=1 Tax=unclassified Psychrobacillus TaxID=2636677 RepID=UPI00260B0C4D|nr:macro domain-containing protein [uncultured Psychrobacillus sp.]
MPLEIVRNDITKMQVDAIVNAANQNLQIGGGVCGAIFHEAGAKELQKACNHIGHCQTGEAVITDAFRLDAQYIIHAVGPVWKGGSNGEKDLLTACYNNSLKLALSHGCESVAFPLISSGIYGYPKEQALQVAISTISSFLLNHEMLVYIVVYDKKAFKLSEKLFRSIEEFIDEHYVEEMDISFGRIRREVYELEDSMVLQSSQDLQEIIEHLDESFSERLLRFIDEKGMTDVSVYKNANIDRRLFSKIRNNKDYTPLKKTVVAFAISLRLNLEETNSLLEKAGYTLSRSHKFDVIIEYFIQQENYNIFEINEALFSFDQALLGA